MVTRPRLLDLFCGEGGCSAGYAAAGFDVFGVDLSRAALRRYPYRHHRGDALSYLADYGHRFDAVHASPPCKVHTALQNALPGDDYAAMLFPLATHTDLVADTRDYLEALGRPWIIENVVGAPLLDPVLLCGGMFGLGAECGDGRRELRRHRLFESSFPLTVPPHPPHTGRAIGVYGHGARRSSAVGAYQGTVAENAAALATPWMSRDGLSQAVPPAYTEHIGRQMLAAL